MYREIKIPYGHAIVVFNNQWIAEELKGWVIRQANFFQEAMNRIDSSFTLSVFVPDQSTVFLFNPNYFPRYREFVNYSEIDYGDISRDSLNLLHSFLGQTWNSFFMPYAQENISPHLPIFDAVPIHYGC